jgi:hypothetical protein
MAFGDVGDFVCAGSDASEREIVTAGCGFGKIEYRTSTSQMVSSVIIVRIQITWLMDVI